MGHKKGISRKKKDNLEKLKKDALKTENRGEGLLKKGFEFRQVLEKREMGVWG